MNGWRQAMQIALAISLFCATSGAARGPTVEKTFEESDEVLVNPDCGWVAYNYEDSYAARKRVAGGREPFAAAAVMYTRHPAKAWEAPDGGYEGSAPLKLLEDWIANGRHVAFRIYANVISDLPERTRPKVRAVGSRADGRTVSVIAYWDADYTTEHRKLVEFLGRRLGPSPNLAYVDIGGVGNTGGEWFFGDRRPFEQAGMDDDVFFDLAKTFVEMYRSAFPQTRLFISFEAVTQARRRRDDVLALLLRNDVGIRDDGLGGWPYPRENPPSGAWPMPTFWEKVPVLFEGSGRGGGVYGWTLQGKNPGRVLDWALEKCKPSFINIGGSETKSEQACAELGDLLREYGRKLGYRFALIRAGYPSRVKRGVESSMTLVWANRGVSRCYVNRKIEVVLLDSDGRFVMAFVSSPEPQTTAWLPGKETTVRLPLAIPNTIPPGDYLLKLGMLLGDPRAPRRLVALGTKGADADGYQPIGDIHIVAE